MDEPIKAGDKCIVMDALGQLKSPNTGQVVEVLSIQGIHTRLGRIWRCWGPDIKQLHDNGEYITTGWADFAQSWLKKIDPKSPKQKLEEKESLTA